MSTRALVWAAFALVPLAVAARLLGAGPALLFPLAAGALIPLAWLVSRATEQAGKHTGPAIGGLLNATFGNVPELLIALFAVADGLHDVVRGSLTGSIVGNLLLVLGLTLVVGGRGDLDRRSLIGSLIVVAVAVPLLAVAALPHLLDGDRERAFAAYTVPAAVVLLVVYAAATAYELRKPTRDEEAGPPDWTLRRSLTLLAVSMLATAAVSETITGSIGPFAQRLGLSEFFVAAVIVALAGNASEHGAAVVAAAHGEFKLGTDVALESTAQVAAFVVPAVALLSFAVEPLPLAFTVPELAVLAGAVVLASAVLAHGPADRVRGLVLLGAYAVAVAVFLLV